MSKSKAQDAKSGAAIGSEAWRKMPRFDSSVRIILALLAFSLVALFFWAQYVVGLRSAGDVDALQSNHMLETALIAWYVVFIALVLVHSRLTKGDSPRKVPENSRELTITTAKTVCLFGIGMAIALLLGVVLFGMRNSSLHKAKVKVTAAGNSKYKSGSKTVTLTVKVK